METKWLTLPTDDGPMHAYLARPDGAGPYPGVVVMQEAFGVNPYVRSVCDRLAEDGFVALAPELFHREGTHLEVAYDNRPKVLELLASLENDQLQHDASVAVSALRSQAGVAPQRIGVIGFCMGGFVAILAGLTIPIEAAVSFYPGMLVRPRPNFKLTPILARLPELRVPTQIHFGGIDEGIPPEDVELVRAALAASPASHEVIVHPGANHGFHSHDRAPTYHAAAADAAWHQASRWLHRTLNESTIGARRLDSV